MRREQYSNCYLPDVVCLMESVIISGEELSRLNDVVGLSKWEKAELTEVAIIEDPFERVASKEQHISYNKYSYLHSHCIFVAISLIHLQVSDHSLKFQ